MLPFLKKSQEASASSEPKPIVREHDEDFDALESAADDLISAIHSKNTKLVASALRAAFELCDSEPHFEGPHEE